jgi:uncharacterized damage-inducible protein DinB
MEVLGDKAVNEHLYVFRDLEGLTPHISRLVCMMTFVRGGTLEAVQHLSREKLDELVSPTSNSVGMLLAHIANLEKWWQSHTFEGNERFWNNPAGMLGDIGRENIRGHELAYYLNELAVVREVTLEQLSKRDDDWLHETAPFFSNKKLMNNYFKWFHVLEDEISHRGQILLIRRLIS